MRNKVLLGFALIALAVGYIELRLPEPVSAQGTDAVFQRLAVSNDARVSGTATVGVLKFETALTPTITALLAASGAASARTYLRGDGSWQGVSPPTYWDLDTVNLLTSDQTTWTDTGLELAVTASAGDTVILNVNFGSFTSCYVRIFGGSTALQNRSIRASSTSSRDEVFNMTFVDVPGAGIHTYKVQVRRDIDGDSSSCRVNGRGNGEWAGSTLFVQVLQ